MAEPDKCVACGKDVLCRHRKALSSNSNILPYIKSFISRYLENQGIAAADGEVDNLLKGN